MKKVKYREIYPSEVAARKISKHLDTMLTERPRVYRKTLSRYKNLAILLLEIVDKICNLLQVESLVCSQDNEFDELSSIEIVDISKKIQEVHEKVNVIDNFTSRSSVSIDKEPKSISLLPIPSAKNTKSESKNKMYDNKYSITQFGSVLKEAVSIDFGYVEVNECASILNQWFECRFLCSSNDNFKYSILQIPKWIAYIIIAFGKYRTEDNLEEFYTQFNGWCDSIKTDPDNIYAIPYVVYQIMKEGSSEDFTVASLIISDILLDKCYFKLCEIRGRIKLDSDFVASIVKSNNSQLVPIVHRRITNQCKLIEELNFTPSAYLNEKVSET